MHTQRAMISAVFEDGTKNFFPCLLNEDMTISPRVGFDDRDDFMSLTELASVLTEYKASDTKISLLDRPNLTSALGADLSIQSPEEFDKHMKVTVALEARQKKTEVVIEKVAPKITKSNPKKKKLKK